MEGEEIQNGGQGDQPSGEPTEPLSFLDDEGNDNSDAGDNDPNTQDADGGEEAEGEEAGDDQGEEAQDDEGEQAEEDSTEDWLSTLTTTERNTYAKRYPSAWKRLNDPNTSEDDKQLLRDKINTDIEYRKLKAQLGEADDQDQPEEEAVEPTKQQTPEERQKAYYAEIDQIVAGVDQKQVNELGMGLLKAFGVDVDAAKDDPEVEALVEKGAPEAGKVLIRGAVDLMETLLPARIQNYMEAAFPGMGRMYNRAMLANQWDMVRNMEVDGARPYEELPEYGTKAFASAMRKAAAAIPNFDKLRFDGSAFDQARAKYELLARVAATGKADPVAVARAAEVGKRQARDSQNRRAAGRALGAGQSRQAVDQGNDGDLDFKSMIAEHNAKQRSTGK